MGYIDTVLDSDERVLGRARVHWLIYAPAVAMFSLGLSMVAIDIFVRSRLAMISLLALLPVLRAVALFVVEWIERTTTEIAVTDQRAIVKRGLIWRAATEMNASQIESVRISQSVLGRLFDFGTIRIEGTGSTIALLRAVAKPLEIRQAISAISKVKGDVTPVRTRAA